jgi:Zn-dependent protease
VNFTSLSLRVAGYLAVSLLIGMMAREYARAFVASRLGDPTPRLWGRLTLNPKSWFDPFGSGLLPGLIIVLWAAAGTFLPPPFAYAKPAPIDPNYFKRRTRDSVFSALAGPIANLVLAAIAGLALRGLGVGSLELLRVLEAFMFTNVCLAVFHLLPIPGLDGARIVALLLPPRPAEVYRNADQYLPLIILVVLFIFAGPVNSIVYSLADGLCRVFSGFGCRPLV